MTSRPMVRSSVLDRLLPGRDIRPLRQAAADAAVPFAVWHVVLFGMAALASAYLAPIASTATTRATGASVLWLPWAHFDAVYYVGIADKGYSAGPGEEWAFYPLYPLVVRVLGYVGGGGHTAHIVVGVLVVLVAARRSGGRVSLPRPLLGIVIAPTGLLAFLAYGWIRTGDGLVTFHVNAERWHRALDWPWVAVGHAIRDAEWGNPENYLFGPLNLAVVAVCLVAPAIMVRRFPSAYTVFTAALLTLPICSGHLQSVGRQALPVVTVLVLLATLTRSRTSTAHQMVVAVSAGLGTVFLVMYVLTVPAIA